MAGIAGAMVMWMLSGLATVLRPASTDQSEEYLFIICVLLFGLTLTVWGYLDDILSELQKANGKAENPENEETQE